MMKKLDINCSLKAIINYLHYYVSTCETIRKAQFEIISLYIQGNYFSSIQ